MVKWYANDRVERKGNLFDNIGTGAILPRQNSGAMLDYVHTLNSTTTINSRFGWTRFSDHETRESTRLRHDVDRLPAVACRRVHQSGAAADLIRRHDGVAGPTGGNVAGAGFDVCLRFVPMVHVGDLRARQAHAESTAPIPLPARNLDQLRQLGRQLHLRHELDPRPARQRGRARRNGQAFASLLLGLPTAGQFDVNTDRDNHASYAAFFFQDDWRPRLGSDHQSRPALRAGDWHGRDGRSDAGRLRRDLGQQRHRSGARGIRGQPAARTFRRARSTRPAARSSRRRRTAGLQHAAQRVLAEVRRRLHARRRSAARPCFAAASASSTTPTARPAFSSRGSARPRQYVATLDGFLTAGGDALESVPGGILQPVAAARGLDQNLGQAIDLYEPVAGAALLAALHRRRAARLGRACVARGHLRVQPVQGPARQPRAKLHAGAVPEHVGRARSGDDQPSDRQRPQPIPGAAARDFLERPTIPYEQLVRCVPAVHRPDGQQRQRSAARTST